MIRSMSGRIVNIIYNKSGQIDREQVNLACSYLDKGGVIALPTDTIYGIAAKVDDSNALDKIYKIKNRDTTKPLSICLSQIDEVDSITNQKLHPKILRSLLPGPITILLKRGENLNKDLNPGIDTIGVRVPNHNFIVMVARMVGPLALTSANRSGETSPLMAEDFKELWPELDCVFDCGLLQKQLDDNLSNNQRLGSTVVDLTQPNVYNIVREGCALNRTINLLHRFGYRNSKIK